MSRLEIIGREELVMGGYGDDDLEEILGAYELVGRKRRGAQHPAAYRGGGNPMQMAAAMKMANAGVIVKEKEPTKARRLYLPMASNGTVAANASATITARPQAIAFKPQKIVVPASIAPDFTIDSVLVGVKPQAVQSGSAPAEAFVQNAVDTEMDMDTVQTSQDFVLTVTNQSGAARQFRATVFGRSAD